MSDHRRLLITLFSLVSLLLATSASPPPPVGSCGVDGPFCQEGFCCSKWGWCGNTSDYCDPEHCLSQCPSSPPPPPPPAGSCGVGGPFCQEGFCCSKWGWCGNTPDYCDPEHCQSQCPSSPPPPPSTSPPPPPAGSCGVGGPFCQEGFCCSKWGWCGNTSDYCDPEHCQSQCPSSTPPPPSTSPPPPPAGSCGVGGPFCQEGFCCSKWGWCGNTSDYCDPEHCQSQCPSSPPPPPSTSPPPHPAGSCGVGGPFCQEGFCCSKWGWCGNTSDYCDPEHCQSQCPSSTPPPPSTSPPPPPAGSCGVGGPFCQEGFCCSKWGWCGNTSDYCDPEHCQSQCPSSTPPPPPPPSTSPPPPPLGPTPPGEDISSLIPRSLFEEMLLHRNDNACPASGFYTYDAFITAAKSFPAFATTGDTDTRKRELAAFFAQTSHETTGGWAGAPDGPYSWGYCFVEEIYKGDYCVWNAQWPCVPGKQYYGRGPIQLSYNYNYGPCGEALGVDLLSNPDLVAKDTVLSFKSALWFWMTPQPPKPSCHDVIIQNWTPSPADNAAGRLPGFGLTTNIINGGLECGHGTDPRVESRIGFYKRYCDLFGVSYGDNLDCYNQGPFGLLLLNTM